jgi:peptidoglycan/LPS O-acetylase OafA/YrhL
MKTIAQCAPGSATTDAVAAANPESAKVAEYALFDVLRFLLAAAVMLSHMGVLRWINAGNLAVQVFFALSGWLIGSILCRTKAGELSRFYFNRATRIWIPYFATVITLYVVSLIHEPVRSSRWYEFLVYDVTFTHNWFTLWPNAQLALSEMPLHGTGNHFWSIAVEEQFYLVAPLFLTILPFGRRILPWMIIAATAFLAQSQYTSVSLGVLCAVLANHYRDWFLTVRARIALVAAATVCALLLMFSSVYNFAAPIFSISVVLLCAVPSGRNGVTQWFGGVSFPFYLNAWVGIFALHALVKHFAIPEGWYSMPLEFLSGLSAAAISYHLIDRTVMRSRNKYYAPHLGWMLGGVAYTLLTLGVAYWLL